MQLESQNSVKFRRTFHLIASASWRHLSSMGAATRPEGTCKSCLGGGARRVIVLMPSVLAHRRTQGVIMMLSASFLEDQAFSLQVGSRICWTLLVTRPRSTGWSYAGGVLTLCAKYNKTIVFYRIVDQSLNVVNKLCLRFTKIGDGLACPYPISGKSNAQYF